MTILTLRLSGKLYIHKKIYCFHICNTKFTYEDTAVQPARCVFTRSSICWTQAAQILFCIDNARKRSFTEVALNSVLEENAIDFAWEFCWNFCWIFILQFNFFTNGVYMLFFPIISSAVQSSTFDCVLRAVQCVLCALCTKKQVRGFCVFARTMGLWPYASFMSEKLNSIFFSDSGVPLTDLSKTDLRNNQEELWEQSDNRFKSWAN